MPTAWIERLGVSLAQEAPFRGLALRSATLDDETMLYALHRDAMRDYVNATWGWDETWQRAHFARVYRPSHNAVIVRTSSMRDVGRISLTRHWGRIFLRDVELIDTERNRGIGGAIVAAVIEMARASNRHVELYVLDRNPAQRLYARLGFRVIEDDGSRRTMRAD